MKDLVNKHDNPWIQIEQLQMEIERLTKQWDIACSAAEDHHEFVLAQINSGLKEEIEQLKKVPTMIDIVDRLRGENEKWLELVEEQRHHIEWLTECLKIRNQKT